MESKKSSKINESKIQAAREKAYDGVYQYQLADAQHIYMINRAIHKNSLKLKNPIPLIKKIDLDIILGNADPIEGTRLDTAKRFGVAIYGCTSEESVAEGENHRNFKFNFPTTKFQTTYFIDFMRKNGRKPRIGEWLDVIASDKSLAW